MWRHSQILLGCAFFHDILKPISVLCKYLQSGQLRIVNAIEAIPRTMNEWASQPPCPSKELLYFLLFLFVSFSLCQTSCFVVYTYQNWLYLRTCMVLSAQTGTVMSIFFTLCIVTCLFFTYSILKSVSGVLHVLDTGIYYLKLI